MLFDRFLVPLKLFLYFLETSNSYGDTLCNKFNQKLLLEVRLLKSPQSENWQLFCDLFSEKTIESINLSYMFDSVIDCLLLSSGIT